MFRKILIANRGEIACRVIVTARRMGVGTVAVYSDADAGARHVALADEAVRIGGPAPADSYLRGDAIIAAALSTGAEAIHPGYGFLSENPDFVDAMVAAGLVFIGPPASAIRAMGLKDAAKALMEKAGVPVVPGYHGEDQDPARLAVEADRIGYPVLIKAVAGGGGKGMRRVEGPEGFADALASAQNEARAAFGNPAVLIEKYVEKPRHIEMQVFGDGGSAIHLFERDCSLQRRHQKVIEEAPAPGMTAEMRQAMGEAATRAAEAIGYSGAGTIEFIIDASEGLRPDRFWFMEMNTRLQVEHPVTEAITGVDLVEWQLRVASGERLPLRQEEIRLSGHAFEARLYAEDVPAGFLPATGRIEHLSFPDFARVDTGVRPGDTISPWYDPMIAKVIVHGATRDIALGLLDRALSESEVAGTVTNLGFLAALARHAGFAAGDVDTGLIARDIDALVARLAPSKAELALAAIATADLLEGGGPFAGFSLWAPLVRPVHFGDETALIAVTGPGAMRIETSAGAVDGVLKQGRWWIDGAPAMARVVVHSKGVTVFGQAIYDFSHHDPLAHDALEADGGLVTHAPMPGLVRRIFVAAGDNVERGDKLAVLEAMKMEHTLLAGSGGRVAELFVGEGSQVDAGAALVRLEADEA